MDVNIPADIAKFLADPTASANLANQVSAAPVQQIEFFTLDNSTGQQMVLQQLSTSDIFELS